VHAGQREPSAFFVPQIADELRRDDYEAIGCWITHTIAGLQEADETNEVMGEVLDDCT
jgi:hypothetical protein